MGGDAEGYTPPQERFSIQLAHREQLRCVQAVVEQCCPRNFHAEEALLYAGVGL